jgi:hypothetical protein
MNNNDVRGSLLEMLSMGETSTTSKRWSSLSEREGKGRKKQQGKRSKSKQK